MAETKDSSNSWQSSDRPPHLFRRFQFDAYSQTRDFLDRLAELSEKTGLYPDISFGTTYANITIHARDTKSISDEDKLFARQIDEISGSSG